MKNITMGKTYKKKGSKKPAKKTTSKPRKTKVNTGLKAYAVRSETYSLALTAGAILDYRDLTLADLSVSKQIAQFYALYRITSVQMRFKPNTDTYIATATPSPAAQLPYLNYIIDRTASIPVNINAASFEQLGVKPVRFDDKTIMRSYKPSVLQANVGAGVAPLPVLQVGSYKMSPWLPTNAAASDEEVTTFQPSNVEHHGCLFYISKVNVNDQQVYDIDVTITTEFSKPLTELVSSEKALPRVSKQQAHDLAIQMGLGN